MASPVFSVVIPTYNRASFLRAAVDSVLHQTFRDFEVIVVDDGSTDDTASVIKQFNDDRVKYVKKVNGERASARNRGIQEARGRYINFLDSDDVLYDVHLQQAFEFLESNDPELFHLGYDLKTPEGEVLKLVADIRSINDQILDGNLLSCSGVFAKKEVLLQNPFQEDRALAALEDWELWIRLSARYNFQHVNKITSTIIHHVERSVIADDEARIIAKVDAFVKYIGEDKVSSAHFGKRLRRAIASAYTYAALHLLMARSGRRLAISYFWKGILAHPAVLFTKRSAVVILKWLGVR